MYLAVFGSEKETGTSSLDDYMSLVARFASIRQRPCRDRLPAKSMIFHR